MRLNELAAEVVAINRANGWDVLTEADWNNPVRLLTYLMLQVTEIGEAAEEVLASEQEDELRPDTVGAHLASIMESVVVYCHEVERIRKPGSEPNPPKTPIGGPLNRESVAEELADTLIRVLDMTGGLGIDLDEAVRAKLEKNRQRGYKHGGKLV